MINEQDIPRSDRVPGHARIATVPFPLLLLLSPLPAARCLTLSGLARLRARSSLTLSRTTRTSPAATVRASTPDQVPGHHAPTGKRPTLLRRIAHHEHQGIQQFYYSVVHSSSALPW